MDLSRSARLAMFGLIACYVLMLAACSPEKSLTITQHLAHNQTPPASLIRGQYHVRLSDQVDIAWYSDAPTNIYLTPLGNAFYYVYLRRYLRLTLSNDAGDKLGIISFPLHSTIPGVCDEPQSFQTVVTSSATAFNPIVTTSRGTPVGLIRDGMLQQSTITGWARNDVAPLVERIVPVDMGLCNGLTRMQYSLIQCPHSGGVRVVSYDTDILAEVMASNLLDSSASVCALFLSMELTSKGEVIAEGSCIIWGFRQADGAWYSWGGPVFDVKKNSSDLKNIELSMSLVDSRQKVSEYVSTAVKMYCRGRSDVSLRNDICKQ